MNLKPTVPACVLIGTLTLFASTGVAQYTQSNLVANRTGFQAGNIDARLLNPWGLALCPLDRQEGAAESQESPEGSDREPLICVADAFAGVATVYTHSGRTIPIVVNVPPAPSSPVTFGFPAGIVFNSTSDFVISKNGKSGPAELIFSTLDGTISGWNPDVDPTNAIIMVDYSTNKPNRPFPAVYTGLEIGRDSKGHNVIYAADSGNTLATSNNEIDMFNGKFQLIGHFTDLNGTSGMAVYGIQSVKGKLYVTFGTFSSFGGGVVDIFDRDGKLLTPAHFAQNSPGGPLEEPWGIALAPEDFGQFSNAILIGNVDDGRINAFNRDTHQFLGQLKDPQGNLLIGADGLWGLIFGRGERNEGGSKKLFFAAGPNFYADGLFGVISPAGENEASLKKAVPALLPSAVQKSRVGRPHPPR
jgi:uncharacterized protein (TIGR03118 family)